MAIIRKKKPVTLPEIRPNAGIERKYQTLVAEFRKQAKQEKLAMDGISDWVAHVIDYLSIRWQKKLDDLAPQIASMFVNRTVSNYETLMKTYMRRAGFTVRFQVTPFQRESLQAVIGNNVGLIKSIASQHLERVQVQVWQCVTQGYDLSTLSKNLKKDYGITKR